MPELKGPRRLYGGKKSEPGARVKAAAAEGGGASAPVLRRATGSDIIKAGKSTLTSKTVAHSSRSLEAALMETALMKARPDFNPPWFTVGAMETFATALGLALVLAFSWLGPRLGALVEAAPAPRSPPALASL